jgi:hypothetical protein
MPPEVVLKTLIMLKRPPLWRDHTLLLKQELLCLPRPTRRRPVFFHYCDRDDPAAYFTIGGSPLQNRRYGREQAVWKRIEGMEENKRYGRKHKLHL